MIKLDVRWLKHYPYRMTFNVPISPASAVASYSARTVGYTDRSGTVRTTPPPQCRHLLPLAVGRRMTVTDLTVSGVRLSGGHMSPAVRAAPCPVLSAVSRANGELGAAPTLWSVLARSLWWSWGVRSSRAAHCNSTNTRRQVTMGS